MTVLVVIGVTGGIAYVLSLVYSIVAHAFGATQKAKSKKKGGEKHEGD